MTASIDHIIAPIRKRIGENDNKFKTYDFNMERANAQALIRGISLPVPIKRLRLTDMSGATIEASFFQITESVALNTQSTIVITVGPDDRDNVLIPENSEIWLNTTDVTLIFRNLPEDVITHTDAPA